MLIDYSRDDDTPSPVSETTLTNVVLIKPSKWCGIKIPSSTNLLVHNLRYSFWLILSDPNFMIMNLLDFPQFTIYGFSLLFQINDTFAHIELIFWTLRFVFRIIFEAKIKDHALDVSKTLINSVVIWLILPNLTKVLNILQALVTFNGGKKFLSQHVLTLIQSLNP